MNRFRLNHSLTIAIILCTGLRAAEWLSPTAEEPRPESVREADTPPGSPVVPWVLRRIPLKGAGTFVGAGGEPETALRFSPDASLLAIGTCEGRVLLYDLRAGIVRWDKQVADGLIKALAFSADGETLFIGEQSLDGGVTSRSVRDGSPAGLRFALGPDLVRGTPPERNDPFAPYRMPGCYALRVLPGGDLLMAGNHAWGDYRSFRDMRRLARIYRLAPDGTVRATFPKDGPLHGTILDLDADPRGRIVAFLSGLPDGEDHPGTRTEPKSLYVLDGDSLTVKGRHAFSPLEPYFRDADFWRSLSVAADGASCTVGLLDGRTYILDTDGPSVRREFAFGAPVMVGGIPLSARATFTLSAPDGYAYFQTGNTGVVNPDVVQDTVPPPGPHPAANTITVVGPEGQIAWRFRSGHSFLMFRNDAEGRYLLVPARRETEGVREAGAFLFDTRRSGGGSAKVACFYGVEGMVYYVADLAPDGSAWAITEIPYLSPESGKTVGDYRVHVVR